MIDLLPHVKNINHTHAKDYAGVTFYIEECRGEGCKRDSHPVDKANTGTGKCTTIEQKLVLDEIMISGKGMYGKHEDKKYSIPIRWYNFCWSVSEVQKMFPHLKDFDILVKALKHAQLNNFDPAGQPNNMAERLGYTSYSKFLDSFDPHTMK